MPRLLRRGGDGAGVDMFASDAAALLVVVVVVVELRDGSSCISELVSGKNVAYLFFWLLRGMRRVYLD